MVILSGRREVQRTKDLHKKKVGNLNQHRFSHFWISYFVARATFIQILTFAHATLSTLCACQTALVVARCACWYRLRSALVTLRFGLLLSWQGAHCDIARETSRHFARVGSLSLQRGARFRLAPTDPGIEISTKFFHDDLVRFSCKCLCEGLAKVLVRRFCRRVFGAFCREKTWLFNQQCIGPTATNLCLGMVKKNGWT